MKSKRRQRRRKDKINWICGEKRTKDERVVRNHPMRIREMGWKMIIRKGKEENEKWIICWKWREIVELPTFLLLMEVEFHSIQHTRQLKWWNLHNHHRYPQQGFAMFAQNFNSARISRITSMWTFKKNKIIHSHNSSQLNTSWYHLEVKREEMRIHERWSVKAENRQFMSSCSH